jgi:hypothetical protein
MSKATRLFAKIDEVTERTQLLQPADAHRLIAGVDERLVLCTRNEASILVVQLLGAYPDIAMMRDDPSTSKDFALYIVKLHEAFSQFSYAIGLAIVHGGTGLPAKSPYKPKPNDITKFGEAERDKLLAVKTMAQRHIAEAKRRAEEKAKVEHFERNRPSAERRAEQVRELLHNFAERKLA